MQVPNSRRLSLSREGDVMTPMIDVVFLLLIFFVVAAAGQRREAALATTLSAPGSIEGQADVERDPWIVEVWLKLTVDPGGRTRVTMNDREMQNAEVLSQQLQAVVALEPATPIILQIDGEVPMRDVVMVDDLCRAAGCRAINFAARAEDVQRPATDP